MRRENQKSLASRPCNSSASHTSKSVKNVPGLSVKKITNQSACS